MNGKGGGGGIGSRAWTLVGAEPAPRIGAVPQRILLGAFWRRPGRPLLPITVSMALWHYYYGARRNDALETCQTCFNLNKPPV